MIKNLLDRVFYDLSYKDYIIVKYTEFDKYLKGMDVDIFCINSEDIAKSISDSLLKNIDSSAFNMSIKNFSADHVQVDVLEKNNIIIKFDIYSKLPRYKKLNIKDELFFTLFNSPKVLYRESKNEKYGLKLANKIDELLIRYFEYLEYYEIRPDKIKHLEFIELKLSKMSVIEKTVFFEKLHLYTRFIVEIPKKNKGIKYFINYSLFFFKKVLRKIKKILIS